MKKTIYTLMSAALLCGCDGFYGTFDDGSQEFVEIAAVNRSSMPVSLNIHGTYWADPQDTVFLKPHNGVWKTEESRKNYHGQEILPIKYSLIRADFNDGERVIWFDRFSELPHNPCAPEAKEIWDDRYQHRMIEFSDDICESIFAKQDSLRLSEISLSFSPSEIVWSLVVPGSDERYYMDLFPSDDIRDKLRLGSAVCCEAESIAKVRLVDGLCYEADMIETSSETDHRSVACYYDLEHLRNYGLEYFGCDFAALTGRADGKFDSFCGIALLDVHVAKVERIADRVVDKEHLEDILAILETISEPVGFVDCIDYGNFMLLLAEGDCSHENINNYLQKKLLREDPSEYYADQDCYTPQIRFHLITLDDSGSIVCRSGGEELAAVFYKGYETPALHPLSYSLSDLQGNRKYVHVK